MQQPATPALHDLLREWSEVRFDSSPHILPGDETLLDSAVRERAVAAYDSWSEFTSASDFGSPDGKLHLSLIPLPYFGRIESAPVVVLMLNPGFIPLDYFGEERFPGFRQALIRNLSSDFTRPAFPNLFLDPDFAWHSVFQYWHNKLSSLIESFAETRVVTRREALSAFSRSLAVLQLGSEPAYLNALFGRKVEKVLEMPFFVG